MEDPRRGGRGRGGRGGGRGGRGGSAGSGRGGDRSFESPAKRGREGGGWGGSGGSGRGFGGEPRYYSSQGQRTGGTGDGGMAAYASCLEFPAEGWLKHFTRASRTRSRDDLRNLRIAIQKGTIAACEQGFYLYDGDSVNLPSGDDLKQLLADTKLLHLKDLSSVIRRTPRFESTTHRVVEGDCLEAAIELVERGRKPLVLNMASHKRPGGGYQTGAGAQEENLFRRSNYYQPLENMRRSYPIPEFAGFYSPGVAVFRAAESKGYAFLPAPVNLDFVAVAAYANPPVSHNFGEMRLASHAAENTKKKIRVICDIALYGEHDSLVLSAFGCGAFSNPPGHVAELFRDVLREYHGCFQEVVFAIFDDHNARKEHNPEGNVLPFQRMFEGRDRNATSTLGDKRQ